MDVNNLNNTGLICGEGDDRPFIFYNYIDASKNTFYINRKIFTTAIEVFGKSFFKNVDCSGLYVDGSMVVRGNLEINDLRHPVTTAPAITTLRAFLDVSNNGIFSVLVQTESGSLHVSEFILHGVNVGVAMEEANAQRIQFESSGFDEIVHATPIQWSWVDTLRKKLIYLLEACPGTTELKWTFTPDRYSLYDNSWDLSGTNPGNIKRYYSGSIFDREWADPCLCPVVEERIFLNPGTYKFIFYDAYGDGIFPAYDDHGGGGSFKMEKNVSFMQDPSTGHTIQDQWQTIFSHSQKLDTGTSQQRTFGFLKFCFTIREHAF